MANFYKFFTDGFPDDYFTCQAVGDESPMPRKCFNYVCSFRTDKLNDNNLFTDKKFDEVKHYRFMGHNHKKL